MGLQLGELQPAIRDIYRALRVEEAVEGKRRYPERVFPFYAPDTQAPDAVDRLATSHRHGVVGCGELKTTLRWESPLLEPLRDIAREAGAFLVDDAAQGLGIRVGGRPLEALGDIGVLSMNFKITGSIMGGGIVCAPEMYELLWQRLERMAEPVDSHRYRNIALGYAVSRLKHRANFLVCSDTAWRACWLPTLQLRCANPPSR